MYKNDITKKRNLIKYFNHLHQWQLDDKNQISFDLTIFSFPISLISMQEPFNLYQGEPSNSHSTKEEEGESEDAILLKVNDLQKKVETNETLLNLHTLFHKKTPDLKLKMSATSNIESLFYFKEHQGEWFSITKKDNLYSIQYISSNHRKITFKTLQIIDDFISTLLDDLKLLIT